jgi:hypothetical protein
MLARIWGKSVFDILLCGFSEVILMCMGVNSFSLSLLGVTILRESGILSLSPNMRAFQSLFYQGFICLFFSSTFSFFSFWDFDDMEFC